MSGEKIDRDLKKNATCCLISLKEHPRKSSCTPTYILSHKPFKKDEPGMMGTAGEIRTNLLGTFLVVQV